MDSGIMGLWKKRAAACAKVLFAVYLVTAVLLLLLALLVWRTGMEEGALRLGIVAVYVFSCFVGGFLTGKLQENRKFIWGLMMGLLYFIILGGITLAVRREFFAGSFLPDLLLCMGGGMLGGMLS